MAGEAHHRPCGLTLPFLALLLACLPGLARADGPGSVFPPIWKLEPTATRFARAHPPGGPLATDGNGHNDADPRYRLYDLTHVELRLRLDIPHQRVKGSVGFDFVVGPSGCNEILLDLTDSLQVDSLALDGAHVPYRHADRQLHVLPPSPLPAYKYSHLDLFYQGHPPLDELQGMMFDAHSDTLAGYPHPAPLVSTLSETNFGPDWWPCKDVTYDKYLCDGYFTLPDTLTAASNGLLVETIPGNDGTATYHWREGYPIATYLVALNVSNFVRWRDSYFSIDSTVTMPVVYYAYPEDEAKAKAAWARTPQIIAEFARLFGEYPFLQEKYGMVEMNWPGGMENQTLTSYGAYLLNFDLASNEEITSHELSHHWFGDLVTPATWKDIWLNEGFAVYCQALWAEHVGGAAAYHAQMATADVPPQFEFQGPIYDPIETFGTTSYQKASWAVHMLRHVLGTDTFFHALQEYLRDFAYGNATTEGLRAVLEQYSQKDLAPFFHSWIYGTGRPIYDVRWSWPGDGHSPGQLTLLVRQTQAESTFVMPVDIGLTFPDAPAETLMVENNRREQLYNFLLPEKPSWLAWDPSGWILKRVGYVAPVSVPGEDQAGSGATRWEISPAWPNPSGGPISVLLHPAGCLSCPLDAGERPTLWVWDVGGRRVGRLRAASGGTEAVYTWDGRAPGGARAAAGVYWIRGADGRFGAARGIVRLP